MSDALAGADGVGVLLVIYFQICLGGIRELVADEETSAPTLGDGVVAEVVAYFAVEAEGADASVDFDGQKEAGAGRDEAAWDGAGGVVEEELRVGGDAEIDELLWGVLCAGGVA